MKKLLTFIATAVFAMGVFACGGAAQTEAPADATDVSMPDTDAEPEISAPQADPVDAMDGYDEEGEEDDMFDSGDNEEVDGEMGDELNGEIADDLF